jgi:hypothetical protein
MNNENIRNLIFYGLTISIGISVLYLLMSLDIFDFDTHYAITDKEAAASFLRTNAQIDGTLAAFLLALTSFLITHKKNFKLTHIFDRNNLDVVMLGMATLIFLFTVLYGLNTLLEIESGTIQANALGSYIDDNYLCTRLAFFFLFIGIWCAFMMRISDGFVDLLNKIQK